MQPARQRVRQWLLAVAGLVGVLAAVPCSADPVKIRLGISTATEENLWLAIARPDLTPNQGKLYTLDWTRFPGADKRFQALEAGALDLASLSANAILFAAAEGVQFKIIASLSRESRRGFYTLFMVRADSSLQSPRDLKGRTISINGFSGSGHLWTKVVLEKNGLAESDVTIVPLPFPAQGEAVKSKQVDVGMFPQPFAAIVQKQLAVRTLYTSKDAAPYEEELVDVIGKDEFLQKNREAVAGFLSDLIATTTFYTANPTEARLAIIKAKLVNIDPETYVGMADYYRDPGVRVDVEALEAMQNLQVKAGFQKVRADLSKYVDLSYLPK